MEKQRTRGLPPFQCLKLKLKDDDEMTLCASWYHKLRISHAALRSILGFAVFWLATVAFLLSHRLCSENLGVACIDFGVSRRLRGNVQIQTSGNVAFNASSQGYYTSFDALWVEYIF